MDSGRKDASDKIGEKMTPDSSKSTLDKAKEGITDTMDKGARGAVPDSEKSSGQSMMDKAGRSKDDAKGNESVLDKAKDAVGMNKH